MSDRLLDSTLRTIARCRMLLERHSLLTLPFDVRRGGSAESAEREPHLDDGRFDEIARRLDAHLTRRHAGGLVTGALLALGLAVDSEAKKKKKKKKTYCLNGQTTVIKGPKKKLKKKGKKLRKQGATPGACSETDTCSTLDEACGKSSSCKCLLDTSNNKVCLGQPGLSTRKCQSNAGCQAGEFCEKEFEICLPDCAA